MKERPIIFSGSMVKAILEGRKTMTRRVIKPEWWGCLDPEDGDDVLKAIEQCPRGVSGDRLWVRETFYACVGKDQKPRGDVVYKATLNEPDVFPWKSPIHMPRWASRLTLDITDVRVERLQDISEKDARAEGAERKQLFDPANPDTVAYSYRMGFADLWESINGVSGKCWTDNPWVWVIAFKKAAAARHDA